MRHQVFGSKLSGSTEARKSLANNLASAIFARGAIKTTLKKAKFARPYVEKMVTAAKKNLLSNNRILASHLTKDAFAKLISEIAPAFSDRSGGYTRITKLGKRQGDAAPMAKIELLKYEKKIEKKKTSGKKLQKTKDKIVKTKTATKKIKKEKKVQNKKVKK